MSNLRNVLRGGVRRNPEQTSCKTKLVGDARDAAIQKIKVLAKTGTTDREIGDKLGVTPAVAATLRRAAKLHRGGTHCGRAVWWAEKPTTKAAPHVPNRVEIPMDLSQAANAFRGRGAAAINKLYAKFVSLRQAQAATDAAYKASLDPAQSAEGRIRSVRGKVILAGLQKLGFQPTARLVAKNTQKYRNRQR